MITDVVRSEADGIGADGSLDCGGKRQVSVCMN